MFNLRSPALKKFAQSLTQHFPNCLTSKLIVHGMPFNIFQNSYFLKYLCLLGQLWAKYRPQGMPLRWKLVLCPRPHALPLKKAIFYNLVIHKITLCLLLSSTPGSVSHTVLTIGDLAPREDQSHLRQPRLHLATASCKHIYLPTFNGGDLGWVFFLSVLPLHVIGIFFPLVQFCDNYSIFSENYIPTQKYNFLIKHMQYCSQAVVLLSDFIPTFSFSLYPLHTFIWPIAGFQPYIR